MKLWQRMTHQGVYFHHYKSWVSSASGYKRFSNRWLKAISLQRLGLMFLVGVSLSILITACSGGGNQNAGGSASSGAQSNNVELTLVSYAVTQAAYQQIIPKFTTQWKQQHNQDVTFNQSYGGSGSQTRAVIDGLEADIVTLALALDTKKIEKAGLIQSGWEKKAPNNAIITKSVAALVTRQGNPKEVKTWADLAKDGVSVITANPKTSGGARWNFLGLWGSVTKTGGNDSSALAFTTKVFKNVPVLTKDSRESSDVFFKQRQGDVLINYENEVLLAQKNGQTLPYIVPDVNISIDNPVAIVDKNVDKHGTREVAAAFVQYLFQPEAQREFAKTGFRPVDSTVQKEVANNYPKIKTLFTAQDMGGWSEIQKKFFDDSAIFDKIQANLGK